MAVCLPWFDNRRHAAMGCRAPLPNPHSLVTSHQSLVTSHFQKQKRGCEEMKIHFFTAPSFVSFFTPGSKKQEEKGILPPFPQKSAF